MAISDELLLNTDFPWIIKGSTAIVKELFFYKIITQFRQQYTGHIFFAPAGTTSPLFNFIPISTIFLFLLKFLNLLLSKDYPYKKLLDLHNTDPIF